jgi:hypothetical protein
MAKIADAAQEWLRATKALREAKDANERGRERALMQGGVNDLVRAYASSPRQEWDDADKAADAAFEKFLV